jgi:hypothetical protein
MVDERTRQRRYFLVARRLKIMRVSNGEAVVNGSSVLNTGFASVLHAPAYLADWSSLSFRNHADHTSWPKSCNSAMNHRCPLSHAKKRDD